MSDRLDFRRQWLRQIFPILPKGLHRYSFADFKCFSVSAPDSDDDHVRSLKRGRFRAGAKSAEKKTQAWDALWSTLRRFGFNFRESGHTTASQSARAKLGNGREDPGYANGYDNSKIEK